MNIANTDHWFDSDKEFNRLYPLQIQALANKHWSPLAIAREAAGFLGEKTQEKILDIGSGAGKFCLAAAYYTPRSFFYGVEQRQSLIDISDQAKKFLNLGNVQFIHANFTQVDFKNFDHFYFYNSFFENLDSSERIDNSIDYSGELFNYYNRYLFRQLEQKPAGTRLCTLCSWDDEIPPEYHIVRSSQDELLKFWIKI